MTCWQTSTESKDTSATKINKWNGSSNSRWAVWLLIKAFVVLHIKSHATIPTLEARLVPYLTTQTQITRYHHHQSSLLHDNNVHQCRTTAMLQLLKILAIYHPLLVDSARHTLWHSLPQGWPVVLALYNKKQVHYVPCHSETKTGAQCHNHTLQPRRLALYNKWTTKHRNICSHTPCPLQSQCYSLLIKHQISNRSTIWSGLATGVENENNYAIQPTSVGLPVVARATTIHMFQIYIHDTSNAKSVLCTHTIFRVYMYAKLT